MSNSPLSKAQESLRGRRVADMTDDQLALWLRTCETMERWVKAAKSRRDWKAGCADAEAEIARRRAKVDLTNDPVPANSD